MALTYQQKLAKQGQLQAQLRQATTTAQINSVLASAKTDGIDIDPTVLKSVQNSVANLENKAKMDAVAKAAADKAIAEKAAAAKAVTDKAQAEAKAKADAAAKAIADKAKADKAAADKAVADKAAAAKAEADRQAKVLAQQAAAKAELDAANKAREAAGLKPETTPITAAEQKQIDLAKQAAERKAAADAVNKATADKLAAKQAAEAKALDYQNQLAGAKTTGDVNTILAKAKYEGVTINQGYIDSALTAAKQQEARAAATALQTKTTDYQNQIESATTQKQVDDVLAKAKTDGVTVNQYYVDNAANKFKQQAATADFASKLGAPTGFTNKFGPNGQEFVSLAKDPITGAEGGWYQLVGNDMQRVGADGRPTGPIIPAKQFEQQRQTALGNFTTYATQQKTAADTAKMAADVKTFETNLPKPGTAEYNNMVNNRFNSTGPDGQDYQPTANGGWVKSNIPIGANNRTVAVAPDKTTTFTPVGNPTGPTQTLGDINKAFADKAAAQEAAALKARADLIRQQNTPTGLFADIDNLVEKTIGWNTVATILGSAIAGPAGAAFMSATVTMDKGGSLTDIAKSALLSYGMAYGAQALGEALNEAVASGVENGIVDVPDAVEYADGIEQIQPSLTPDAPLFEDPGIEQSINLTPEAPVAPEVPTTVDIPSGPVMPEVPTPPPAFEPPTVEPELGPPAEFTGPVEPTTPVNSPQTSYDLKSYGQNDFPDGRIFKDGITGEEMIADNGKTFKLADYEAAANSGQPVTIDGMMNTGGTVTVEPAPPEFNNMETPYRVDIGGVAGTAESPASAIQELMTPNTQLATIEQIDTGLATWNPAANAWEIGSAPVIPEIVGQLPEVLVTATKELGLTASQIMALGGVAAATAVVASMGAGGAAAAANTAMAAPTTPVSPAPGPTPGPTPVEPPVAQPPVNTPPTVEPVPPVVPPGPTVPPITTPPVVEPPVITPPVVEPPVTTPPVVEPVPPVVEPPVTTPPVVEPPLSPPVEQVIPPSEPIPEVKVHDFSTPYEGPYSNESVLERYLNKTLTYGDIAKLVAAGLVLPSVLGMLAPTPAAPGKKSYGPIPPTNWGSAATLVNPGQNPGWFAGDFPAPAYQTTNPFQSQFYWGQQPYVGPNQPRETYNQIPAAAGTQGFGLQAGPAQYDMNQLLAQINSTALDPTFVGYSQYPTQGYVPPGYTPPAVAGPVMPAPPRALTGFRP